MIRTCNVRLTTAWIWSTVKNKHILFFCRKTNQTKKHLGRNTKRQKPTDF